MLGRPVHAIDLQLIPEEARLGFRRDRQQLVQIKAMEQSLAPVLECFP